MLLVACGDPTATPVQPTAAATTAKATTAAAAAATTVAATTVAATTAVATTAAPTTAPATTVAATTVAATTVAPTTARPTTAAATSALPLPVISGAEEIVVDPAISSELLKSGDLPAGVTPTIRLYASSIDSLKLSNSVDAALDGAGYKSGIPGQQGLSKTGADNNYYGFYIKPGSPDLLLVVADADTPAGFQLDGIPGLSPSAAKKFSEQFKGKKSAVVFIGANGLLQGFLAAGATTATTAAATKPAVATTSAVATGSGKEVSGIGIKITFPATWTSQVSEKGTEGTITGQGPDGTFVVINKFTQGAPVQGDLKSRATSLLDFLKSEYSDLKVITAPEAFSSDTYRMVIGFTDKTTQKLNREVVLIVDDAAEKATFLVEAGTPATNYAAREADLVSILGTIKTS